MNVATVGTGAPGAMMLLLARRTSGSVSSRRLLTFS